MKFCAKRKAIGDIAERAFAEHPDVELIRNATTEEDIYLHFDMIVDIGFGKIYTDVKSFNPTRSFTDQAYIEIKNSSGFHGWAIPNGIRDRYVTWERADDWVTVHIDVINEIIASGDYESRPYKGASLMRVPFSLLADRAAKIIKKEQL